MMILANAYPLGLHDPQVVICLLVLTLLSLLVSVIALIIATRR